MTIDERLEALVGRHEALTQSVELLLADTRAHAEQRRIDGEHVRALLQTTELRHAELGLSNPRRNR
jgi:hypothetical protein